VNTCYATPGQPGFYKLLDGGGQPLFKGTPFPFARTLDTESSRSDTTYTRNEDMTTQAGLPFQLSGTSKEGHVGAAVFVNQCWQKNAQSFTPDAAHNSIRMRLVATASEEVRFTFLTTDGRVWARKIANKSGSSNSIEGLDDLRDVITGNRYDHRPILAVGAMVRIVSDDAPYNIEIHDFEFLTV